MTSQPKLNLKLLANGAIAFLLLALFVFAKTADEPLDSLISALQKWTTANPQEKVYLHTDKPYYAVGDTIWFKGYITTGSRHQLSAISGALYVDLIDERDSVIKSLKLPVTAGMAIGDITLEDDYKAGNYRIRAYTQWMRNAGEAYFYDKTLTVGSVFNNGITTKANYQYKDIDKKNVLTANLNYADEDGAPLAGKNVLYRIVINDKVVWTKNATTDTRGNIQVNVSNENKVDLTGAYIRTVINNNSKKEVVKNFPIKANLSQSDVQFFPESGSLVNGIASRVAFKVVGIDGLGLNVTGKLVDNTNKVIADISTYHAGMGSFNIKPEAGVTYAAKINFADGSVKSIQLPAANSDGYVLSAYQPDKDSILLRVNAKQLSLPQNLHIVAQTGGEIVFASALKLEKPLTSIWLPKKDFPTGIAQFTLFNNAGKPVNERIAFIRSNDLLKLDLKATKSSYKSKEGITLALDAKDGDGKPTAGNFSVSVIDESKVPSNELNETNIFTNLLLTSDIKGYVEKPNYYFTNVNADVDRALDNLMLTQGYRRFVWKDIINQPQTAKPPFTAEGLGLTISGTVKNLSHKPMANANVALMSIRANLVKLATTDAQGRFKFEGIVIADSLAFAVQARSPTGSNKVIIGLDTIPGLRVNKNPNNGDLVTDIPGELKAYIDAEKKQDDIYFKMGRMDQVHRLRQVNIKAKKPKADIYATQWFPVPEALVEKTIEIKNGDNFSLGMYLSGKIPTVTFRPLFVQGLGTSPMFPFYHGKPVRILLNGRGVDAQDAMDLMDFANLQDIVKVEFITSGALLMALNASSPSALNIYTKPYRSSYNPSITNLTPKGFNKARSFYSPVYKADVNLKSPDMRSTIYWNPYLKTNTVGKDSFAFFNGDGPARYKVVIEGINADGQLGRQVFRYQVDGELVSGLFNDVDSKPRIMASRSGTFGKTPSTAKVKIN